MNRDMMREEVVPATVGERLKYERAAHLQVADMSTHTHRAED